MNSFRCIEGAERQVINNSFIVFMRVRSKLDKSCDELVENRSSIIKSF